MSRPSLFMLLPKFDFELSGKANTQHLAHYNKVRVAQDWVELGFNLKFDRYGCAKDTPQRTPYYWGSLFEPTPDELAAFRSGKRCISSVNELFDFFIAGVGFDEFIDHPKHYQDYCYGLLASNKGESLEALKHFEAAKSAAPLESRYLEKYYAFSISLGHADVIKEELAYYSKNIESAIHSGRYDEWIKLLLAFKFHEEAAAVTLRVSELFDSAVSEGYARNLHQTADYSFLVSKRQQFRKKVFKWSNSKRYALLFSALKGLGNVDWLVEDPDLSA